MGALGLIFTDDLSCSCETIIVGFRLVTSILLTTGTLLLGKSTTLVCVNEVVTSMDSMDCSTIVWLLGVGVGLHCTTDEISNGSAGK